MNKRCRKKLHKQFLIDVTYQVSISSHWRKLILSMDSKSINQIDKRNDADLSNFLQRKIRRYNLKYMIVKIPYEQAIGWDDFPADYIFMKFYPTEFSSIYDISSNNPDVV